MKSIQSVFHCLARIFPGIAAVCLLSCFVPVMTTSAETASKTTPTEKSKGKSSEARLRAQWQKDIARLPVPKYGCFTASYPSKQWKEVPCVAAPTRPFLPAQGMRPYTIGGAAPCAGRPISPPGLCDKNQTGISADLRGRPFVTGNQMSWVTGRFDTVLGTTSDHFSLQINTNFFATSWCTPNSSWDPLTQTGCNGWQQFIYTETACGDPALAGKPCVFMQYWLNNLAGCPSEPPPPVPPKVTPWKR